MRRRDEGISSDIQELEASLRQQEVVREQETPAEEIARLKEASHADHLNMDREVSCSSWLPHSSAGCLSHQADVITGKLTSIVNLTLNTTA